MSDADYQRIRRKFDINYYEDQLKANKLAQKKRCERDPNYQRRLQMKHKHGIDITDEEINRAFAAQGGCCAICGKASKEEKEDRNRALAVDHDHSTGNFRGLLCTRCNLGIGYFDDDPICLRNAARYLEKRKRGYIFRGI